MRWCRPPRRPGPGAMGAVTAIDGSGSLHTECVGFDTSENDAVHVVNAIVASQLAADCIPRQVERRGQVTRVASAALVLHACLARGSHPFGRAGNFCSLDSSRATGRQESREGDDQDADLRLGCTVCLRGNEVAKHALDSVFMLR